jgi:hypothetical protein
MTDTQLRDTDYYDAVETFVAVANENPRTADKIGNATAVVTWEVDGETFHLIFNDGTVAARPGAHPKERVTVETDPETLRDVLRGVRDITNFVGEAEVRVVAGQEHFLDLIVMGRVLSACSADLEGAL